MKHSEERQRLGKARDAARMELEVLCLGIGEAFKTAHHSYDSGESVQALLALVNKRLPPVVEEVLQAEKAYEPFRRRLRVTMTRPRPRKKKAAKVQ